MAAGAVVLAHDSGGPKLDIVIPYEDKPTGFLADSEVSFANSMANIFRLGTQKRLEICQNARKAAERFSDDNFKKNFLHVVTPFVESENLLKHD